VYGTQVDCLCEVGNTTVILLRCGLAPKSLFRKDTSLLSHFLQYWATE